MHRQHHLSHHQQHRGSRATGHEVAPCLRRVRDSMGAGCIHYASRGGHVQALRFLVRSVGVRAHERDSAGRTAAHEAAAAGRARALRWIIMHTACRVDDRDVNGDSVLHVAAR
ncbi:hypothetical protein HPB48_010239 [Haemaphysalis longicornis]|uniref:Uncharacterized protein n=1 Tax=Haemaphysalis longicornis TaxID=44386 RepID=A0A9J6GNR1_HAELO|nr:hypothetical protein HPB48_010239 [Haemaphysalis longicornis]